MVVNRLMARTLFGDQNPLGRCASVDLGGEQATVFEIVGIVGAFALTRLLSGMLVSVRPTDPMTFGLVSLLLVVIALAASLLPAHRATKIDPRSALRCE
jgi:ABC-type lipoprotein release transport system permease subunit